MKQLVICWKLLTAERPKISLCYKARVEKKRDDVEKVEKKVPGCSDHVGEELETQLHHMLTKHKWYSIAMVEHVRIVGWEFLREMDESWWRITIAWYLYLCAMYGNIASPNHHVTMFDLKQHGTNV